MAVMEGGRQSLWVRSLDTPDPQQLAGTDGAAFPFWSPDSRFIGFFAAQGKLKKIAATGGPPQTLCDASGGRGATWGRDGVILFCPSPGSVSHRVSSAGGVPSPVTDSKTTGGGQHRFPWFLPDGRHSLFVAPGLRPRSAA